MEAVKKYFPNVSIQNLADYQVLVSQNTAQGDLAKMLYLTGSMQDTLITLTAKTPISYQQVDDSFGDSGFITQQKDSTKTGPRLLQFRDSFSKALVPFLSESFMEAAYIWTKSPSLATIDRQNPDLVIIEFVERFSDLWLELQLK